MTIIVELKIGIYLDNIPKEIYDPEKYSLSEDLIETFQDIANCALPQNVEIMYFGEDKPPVKVFIESYETEEVRCEA